VGVMKKLLFIFSAIVFVFLIGLIFIFNQGVDQSNVSDNCVLYFDGCNYCERDFLGSLVCTKVYCERDQYQDPYCEVYIGDLNQNFEKFLVGYCPTMKNDAFEFKNENKNSILVEYQNASDVLTALNNKKIDLAIIGRKAKKSEINSNIKEEMKKSSFILVFNKKVLIQTNDLNQLTIHTHHLDFPKEYFSLDKVVINSNLDETISNANLNNLPALIKWSEFKDDFELLVVMDDLLKNKDFRGVFFYFY
jgi:hypothetical protein